MNFVLIMERVYNNISLFHNKREYALSTVFLFFETKKCKEFDMLYMGMFTLFLLFLIPRVHLL